MKSTFAANILNYCVKFYVNSIPKRIIVAFIFPVARKQKQRKEEQPRVPRSLFDRPTAALLKMRREAKILKLRQGLIKPFPRPTTPAATSKPLGIEPTQDHPEWLIHEDWALLQVGDQT